MKRRSIVMHRVLPIVVFGIGGAILVFVLVSGITRPSVSGVPDFTSSDVSFTVAFATFLPMGAFVAWRRPDNPIGWIACGVGFLPLMAVGADEYAIRALIIDRGILPLGPEVAWLSTTVWAPGLALVVFLLLLFPTGSLPSPRWKFVGWLVSAATGVVLAAAGSLWTERGRALLGTDDLTTPLVPGPVLEAAVALIFLCISCAAVSVAIRFRHSHGIERQQLKWMAFVAGIAAFLIVVTEGVRYAGADDTGLVIVAGHLLNLSAAGIPIAVAMAMLRYRLYDIDPIINRTLVYGALTAVLAAIYAGLVFGLQAALAPLTAESDLAIAASTLAVAALFRPVRSRVQNFIDRRFYRRKFDAQMTLEDFNTHVRDEVELDALSGRLVTVVRDTMQPAHVWLWLRPNTAGSGGEDL